MYFQALVFFLCWSLCQCICPSGFTVRIWEERNVVNWCHNGNTHESFADGVFACKPGETLTTQYYWPDRNQFLGCIGTAPTLCPNCMYVPEGEISFLGVCAYDQTGELRTWGTGVISGTPTCNTGYTLVTNSWSNGLTHTGCTPAACPNGMSTGARPVTNWCTKSTSSSTFEACYTIPRVCNPGHYYHTSTYSSPAETYTGCIPCNEGYVMATQGNTASACTPCPTGTFAGNKGSSTCTSCPAGQYGATTGRISCQDCGVGTFSVSGLSACISCLPGTISTVVGAGTCTLCDKGKYNSAYGLTLCTNCPVGRFAGDTGLTVCSICPKGTYSLAGSSQCTPCDTSTFAANTESAVCDACPAGSYAGTAGQSQCTPCPTGTYSGAGMSVCFQCDKGTFASLTGLTKCNDCAVGKYAGNTSQSICTSCPPGQFTNTVRSESCQLCLAGSFTGTTGSNTCALCGSGSFSLAGATVCTPCPLGSISVTQGRSECTLCDPATYNDATGVSVCKTCLVNTYSPRGSSSLSHCKSCFTEFLCAYKDYCAISQCPAGTYKAFVQETYCLTNINNGNPSVLCPPCKTTSNCVAGQSWLNFECLGTTNVINECMACSRGPCSLGSYRQPCTTSIDSTCSLSLPICGNNQYLVGHGESTPGVCTPCYNCPHGENPIQECSQYQNRICGTACNRTTPCANNAFCVFQSTNTFGTCNKCPTGYDSNGFICTPCPRGSICDSNGKLQCEGTCSTSLQPICTNRNQPCVSNQCGSYQLNDANALGIYNNIENNCLSHKVCKTGFYLSVSSTGVDTCSPCTNILPNEEAVTFGLTLNNESSCVTQVNRTTYGNKEGFYTSNNIACPSNTVSEQLYASTIDNCILCPTRPANTFIVPNTPRCEWTCMSGFYPLGGICEPEVNIIECNGPGLIFTSNGCVMTPIPWQKAGYGYSEILSTTIITPPLSPTIILGYTSSIVDYSSYSHTTIHGINKRVQGVICSMTTSSAYIYFVFCNTSMIFYWDSILDKPAPLIGNMTIGYQEGFKNQALFENELYISTVPSDPSRLIVVDTWNCLIREVIVGPSGPADFRTRSFLLFGTVFNKKPFCIDIINPQGVFFLHLDIIAFINNYNMICQIHTKRRMYKCLTSYTFIQANFTHMSSYNGSTIVLYYLHQTIEINPVFKACPYDYTSYEGSSCSIYAPFNKGTYGGWYISLSDGMAYQCVEPSCPLGYLPDKCTRNAPATCSPCIIDNPNNYNIQFKRAAACFFDIIHPCPVNTYADDNAICQPCPAMMYTLGPNKTTIYECICPDKLTRVGADMCIMSSPLFPLYERNKCSFTQYEAQYATRTECVHCRDAECTALRNGQYLDNCQGQPKQCLIPIGSRAISKGVRYQDPLSCRWECESDFYVLNGMCVYKNCV